MNGNPVAAWVIWLYDVKVNVRVVLARFDDKAQHYELREKLDY